MALMLGDTGNTKIKNKPGTFRALHLDDFDNALTTIEEEHHQIHAGTHFKCSDYYASVAVYGSSANNIKYVQVSAPNTSVEPHMQWEIYPLSGEAVVEVYEAATLSSSGTSVTAINNNRRVTTTPTVKIKNDSSMSISSAGTLLFKEAVGNAFTGGKARAENELILKKNTKYLFAIKNLSSAAQDINWQFSWYEQIAKTY